MIAILQGHTLQIVVASAVVTVEIGSTLADVAAEGDCLLSGLSILIVVFAEPGVAVRT